VEISEWTTKFLFTTNRTISQLLLTLSTVMMHPTFTQLGCFLLFWNNSTTHCLYATRTILENTGYSYVYDNVYYYQSFEHRLRYTRKTKFNTCLACGDSVV